MRDTKAGAIHERMDKIKNGIANILNDHASKLDELKSRADAQRDRTDVLTTRASSNDSAERVNRAHIEALEAIVYERSFWKRLGHLLFGAEDHSMKYVMKNSIVNRPYANKEKTHAEAQSQEVAQAEASTSTQAAVD